MDGRDSEAQTGDQVPEEPTLPTNGPSNEEPPPNEQRSQDTVPGGAQGDQHPAPNPANGHTQPERYELREDYRRYIAAKTQEPPSHGPSCYRKTLEDVLGDDIKPDMWLAAVATFKAKSEDFLREYVDGQPRSLLYASRELEGILERIETSKLWEEWRNHMQNTAKKTRGIKTAICLGLGPFPRERGSHKEQVWFYQYAAFATICRYIDDKQAEEAKQAGEDKPSTCVRRIFHDPLFNFNTTYLIEKLRRDLDGTNEVVKEPEAEDSVDGRTFLYGIHLPSEVWPAILRPEQAEQQDQEDRQPQLYIGNALESNFGGIDIALAMAFIHDTFYHNLDIANLPFNDPDTDTVTRKSVALFTQSWKFRRTHSMFEFPKVELWNDNIFNDTFIYVPISKEKELAKPAKGETETEQLELGVMQTVDGQLKQLHNVGD